MTANTATTATTEDMTITIKTPAELTLTRFPPDPRSQLRAWDAADEYLLRHVAESGVPSSRRTYAQTAQFGAWETHRARGSYA